MACRFSKHQFSTWQCQGETKPKGEKHRTEVAEATEGAVEPLSDNQG